MFIDALLISSLFLIFAVSHSVLASQGFKSKLTKKLGNKIAFYRLFYNLFSVLIFWLIYIISPKHDYTIYDLSYPFDIVIVLFQIASAITLVWIAKFINMREFLGITQIQRFMNNSYNINDLDEKLELRIDGPFKYSRHPIYLFSSLFLMLRPTMDFFYLIFLINMILYFYIGSYFEEKKLSHVFGEDYKEYQKTVPKIFPGIKLLFVKEETSNE